MIFVITRKGDAHGAHMIDLLSGQGEDVRSLDYETYPQELAMSLGNVQAHMAVSPRLGKWLYICPKQLKKSDCDGYFPSYGKRYA